MRVTQSRGPLSWLVALWLSLSAVSAGALPLYTAREGRTCDNCHTLPNSWKNPELKDRKCSLSCSACHVDPSGGGLRNTAGRFYGQSTLPMLLGTYRGYKDANRFVLPGLGGLESPSQELKDLADAKTLYREAKERTAQAASLVESARLLVSAARAEQRTAEAALSAARAASPSAPQVTPGANPNPSSAPSSSAPKPGETLSAPKPGETLSAPKPGALLSPPSPAPKPAGAPSASTPGEVRAPTPTSPAPAPGALLSPPTPGGSPATQPAPSPEAARLLDAEQRYAAALAAREEAEAALSSHEAEEKAARAKAESARQAYRSAFDKLQDKRAWVFTPAFGSPRGAAPANSPSQGRYGAMNADPLVSLGLDARLASWTVTDTTLVFPMQFDTQIAVQPVQHVTAYVNAGVLAKEKGFAAIAERQNPYAVKDAMLLVNELPYNAYAKVGRFTPQFGTRLDDHTSFTRRDFELDLGTQESRVFGAEIGLAPNYPYASLAVFRPGELDQFSADDPLANEGPSFVGVPGVGAALSAGYRELGWQVGASLLSRRREVSDGGDTDSFSLQWGLNPWFYREKLPLTYLGEYAIGRRQRSSGNNAIQAASFHEVAYSVANGVALRAKYDYSEPDFAVQNDHQHRIGLQLDLTVLPGLRLSAMARNTFVPAQEISEPVGGDFLLFLRGWL